MSTSTYSETLHMYIADRIADLGGDCLSPYTPMRIAENLLFFLQSKYGKLPSADSIHFPNTCKRDEEDMAVEVQVSVAVFIDGKLEVPITIVTSEREGPIEKLGDRLEELIKPMLG